MPTKSQTNASYANDTRAVYVDDYGAVGDGVTDDTAAFNAAFAASNVVHGSAGKVYVVSNIEMSGKKFYGNFCKLVVGAGAKYAIRLTGFRPGLRDVQIGDPDRNIPVETTVQSNASAGALSFDVADPTGIEVGMVCCVYMQGLNRWHVALVDSVSSNTVGLIQDVARGVDASLEGDITSGDEVAFGWGAINIRGAKLAKLSDVSCVNTTFGIVSDMDTDAGLQYTNEKHTWNQLLIQSTEYVGVFIGRECHDGRYNDVNIRGGKVRVETFTGSGSAGPYEPKYPVWQKKNLTVFVDGVAREEGGTGQYDYTINTSSQITFNNPVPNPLEIRLSHSERNPAGLVIDSTGFDSIRGGNSWTGCEWLGFNRGGVYRACALTEFLNCISDSNRECTYMKNCDKVVFSDYFTGFADVPVNIDDGCINITFTGATTATQVSDASSLVSGVKDPNPIRVHSNSVIVLDTNGLPDNGIKNWFDVDGEVSARGAEVVYLSSVAQLNPATGTYYLGLHGEGTSLGSDVIPPTFKKRLVRLQAYAGTPAGTGESFTYTVVRSSTDTLSSVTSEGVVTTSEDTGDWLFETQNWHVRVDISSASAANTRHRVAVTFI